MTHIFISYSRVDIKTTKVLGELLGHAYDNVWYDKVKLMGGEKWWETILTNIETCNHFIFILSPESITSEYCQKELNLALKLNKHIIPLRIRERTPIPKLLESLQCIDSFDEITVDGLNKIYAAIVRKNATEQPYESKTATSPADIRTLSSIWSFITGRKMRTLIREVEIESISEETFNSFDEFKNLRLLPEFEFLNRQLEKVFSKFTSDLAEFMYITSINVWRDRYTNSYVSARKSASNEGRPLENETEVILHYEKEVINRAKMLQRQHHKLVQTIKTQLPDFELEKV